VTTLRNLFYVLIGAVLAIFIYFNFDQRVVIFNTRSWHTKELPLSLALFGTMILGFGVAAILAIADQIRLRSRIRQMRRTIEQLESELGERRTPPLESPPRPAEPAVNEETGPEAL